MSGGSGVYCVLLAVRKLASARFPNLQYTSEEVCLSPTAPEYAQIVFLCDLVLV